MKLFNFAGEALASQLIVFFFGILVGRLWAWFKRMKSSKKVSDYFKDSKFQLGIETIDYGNPCFVQTNIMNTGEEYILDFEESNKDTYEYFLQHVDRKQLCDIFKVSEIDLEIIFNQSVDFVYHQFQNKENGKLFNGDLYGVSKVIPFQRSEDKDEKPKLDVEVYETDYFTMNVMFEILKELRDKNPKVELERDELTYFRNSIGVNVILVLPETREIVLVRRSMNSSYSSDGRTIYPSVVETMTSSDYGQTIDLESCIRRGIEEELGLTRDEISLDSIEVVSMFYECNYSQDNFMAVVHAKDNIRLHHITEKLGKDRLLEVEEIFTLNNSKTSIRKYIEANRSELQFQTIYCLEMYMKLYL